MFPPTISLVPQFHQLVFQDIKISLLNHVVLAHHFLLWWLYFSRFGSGVRHWAWRRHGCHCCNRAGPAEAEEMAQKKKRSQGKYRTVGWMVSAYGPISILLFVLFSPSFYFLVFFFAFFSFLSPSPFFSVVRPLFPCFSTSSYLFSISCGLRYCSLSLKGWPYDSELLALKC